MEENVHRRRMPKVVTQNGEDPYEGRAFEVQLGRGHVDLRQKRPLEGRKRQAEFDTLEDGGVKEEKGFP